MGNYESHTSWYEEMDCLSTNVLLPLFLTLFGVISQALLSFLITAEDIHTAKGSQHVADDETQKKSSPDTESTCICCSAYKSSTCGKIFVRCLIIWQIITMLIIFALDVNKWFEWEDEQDLINDTNTWENYQCFSAIVITSSNYSTLVVNFGGMIAHPDWKNPFRLAWNICVCSLFAFYFLWMIMYGLAGTLLYCYLVLPIAGIMICMKFVCNCDGVSRRCYRQLIFPILLIFIVIILSLTCVNWFSGTLDYWISFELVLFERQYKVYFKHTLKSGEAVFRFFTAFLG